MTLGGVGRAEVSELRHRLRETPVVANTVVGVLSKMFSLAEAWGLVPPGRNPCRTVRRYRTRPRERFLTPVEFRRLSRKHLHRYLAEFSGRHNIRPMDTLDQIIAISDGMNGKRLRYKDLVAQEIRRSPKGLYLF